MGVIVFKGEGKGNNIGIGQAFSGLKGPERFPSQVDANVAEQTMLNGIPL